MVVSAGLVVFRRGPGGLQVLVAHMGGPFWARRERAWTIPKGLPDEGEDPLGAAAREFTEELGAPPPPARDDIPLGEVRQSGGKRVVAWAREALADDEAHALDGPVASNLAVVEWPPRSGRMVEVPEVDRVAWLTPHEARAVVVAAQAEFFTRLEGLLA